MLTLLHASWNANPGIRAAILVNIFLLAVALIAAPFDHRLILGLNPWIKPMKFDISVIIFLLTIAAMLTALPSTPARWQHHSAIIGWGIGIALIVENSIISLQSLRGVRSHMNFDTATDALLFAGMGLAIAVSTGLAAWLLVLFCSTPTTWPAPAAWGARLGLATLLAGSLEGFYMIIRYQAHTVGAPDGGPGLHFVNWSTLHGDLRVAHFFALHALQLLPLIGWAISRTQLPRPTQLAAVALAFTFYFAFIFTLFRQAIRGVPLLG